MKPSIRIAPLALASAALLVSGCTVAPPAGAPGASPSPVASSALSAGAPSPSDSIDPSATDTPAEAQGTPTLGATLSPAPSAGMPGNETTPGAETTPGVEPSSGPSTDPSAGATMPDASGAPTTVPSGPGTPSLVNVGPGQSVTLGIQNAFNADGWASGIYQPAAGMAQAQALATTVNCGQPAPALEFRFAPTRGNLKLNVGQDIMSASSDNTVEFVLYTDGKAVAQKSVTFKQSAELSAPLAGVTVVKVAAKTTGACTTSTTALVTKAVVTG